MLFCRPITPVERKAADGLELRASAWWRGLDPATRAELRRRYVRPELEGYQRLSRIWSGTLFGMCLGIGLGSTFAKADDTKDFRWAMLITLAVLFAGQVACQVWDAVLQRRLDALEPPDPT